eukprot:605096-Prorocentrum_minimum.AAC.1
MGTFLTGGGLDDGGPRYGLSFLPPFSYGEREYTSAVRQRWKVTEVESTVMPLVKTSFSAPYTKKSVSFVSSANTSGSRAMYLPRPAGGIFYLVFRVIGRLGNIWE